MECAYYFDFKTVTLHVTVAAPSTIKNCLSRQHEFPKVKPLVERQNKTLGLPILATITQRTGSEPCDEDSF